MKKMKRIICFLFAVLFVVLACPFTVSAASNIGATGVYSDLKTMGVDLSLYKKDTTDDKGAKVMYFLEYAFDELGNHSDYGLYLYVYNPTCEEIVKNSPYNTVQLSSFNADGSVKSTNKYKLICLSSSTDNDGEGLKNLYYKFKINVDASFIDKANLNPAQRRYQITDLELQYPGEINPRLSDIQNTYVCTGFQEYRNAKRNNVSTHNCWYESFETISVELHPASWKTATSDKGANYQYEVSSVYFNVPNYYLEKYGNMADEKFRGLKSVHCEWYEYKINTLITNNGEVNELALDVVNKSIPSEYYDNLKYYPVFDFGFSSFRKGAYLSDEVSFNVDFFGASILPKKINLVFRDNLSQFNIISSEEIIDAMIEQHNGEGFSYQPSVDQGRKKGHNETDIDVDDKPLNDQIRSYYEARGGFLSWLFGLDDDKNGYSDIEPIVMISEGDVESLTLDDEKLAADLFVTEDDLEELRDFYEDQTEKKQTVYLMRFAVTDYYCADVDVYKEVQHFITGEQYLGEGVGYEYAGDHYYAEKTIFHNFDIIDFTFKNKDNIKTVVPVSSRPITIVGEITPGPMDQNRGDPPPEGCAVMDLKDSLKFVVLLVGAAVVAFVVSKLASPIGKIIKFGAERSDKHYERRQKRREQKRKRKEEKDNTIRVDKNTGEVKKE